jgi:hypothetical protein
MIGYNRLGGDDDSCGRGGRFAQRSSCRLFLAEAALSVTDRERGRDFSAEIHRLPDDRRQLVFRVRREIAEGTYDTPEKLEIAVERLLDRLGADDYR